jgi:hypothetical protein
MRKRAGRKEYKEKDREDGGRMAKRRWRGRRDTRGINKEDDGEELGRESLRRHRHPPYYLLFTISLLLVYFVLSILFLQISSSIPVSLLPHPPHYLHPFPY